MKILKIVATVVFLITQIWIACSLAKIASAINDRKELKVKSSASVSGDVFINNHNFTPKWQ